MKLKRILCAVLALMLALTAALGMVGCDNAEDDDAPAPVYTLGNIRETATAYTIIRADNATKMVRDAAMLVRSTIEQVIGTQLEISEDWVEDPSTLDPAAREILVGDTNRPESDTAMAELSEQKPYTVTQVNNKICIVGLDEYSVRRAVYQFLAMYFDYEIANYNYHNVIDFGAEGDGIRDETASFQAAIAAAEADGLPIYVPAGTYIITDTLTLDSVTMYGYSSGAWTSDTANLPVIIHKNLEYPLFHVAGGSLSGFSIKVEGVTANEDEMEVIPAETIMISKAGTRVSNLRISNPYIGISTYYEPDSPINPGRCFIENIFMVNVFNTGMYVHGTFDVATLTNIEVWNPNTAGEGKLTCPVAYKFGKNDDLRAVNLFAFNAQVGFLFEESLVGHDEEGNKVYGGCWGSFTNCSTDLSESGIQVGKGHHALTFIGGTYWNHHYGLQVLPKTSESTRVTMSGCELKTNGSNTIFVGGGQMVTVTGCNISRTLDGHSASPVKIDACAGAITLTGNTICTNGGAAVEITAALKGAATITGNTVITAAMTTTNVIVNASSGKNVIIDNNAILTGYKFAPADTQ